MKKIVNLQILSQISSRSLRRRELGELHVWSTEICNGFDLNSEAPSAILGIV